MTQFKDKSEAGSSSRPRSSPPVLMAGDILL